MTLEYRRVLASLAAEDGSLRPDATWDLFARRRPAAPLDGSEA
jgi:hypothetical protein